MTDMLLLYVMLLHVGLFYKVSYGQKYIVRLARTKTVQNTLGTGKFQSLIFANQ